MTSRGQRVVITGAGVISAVGAGVEQFERALFQGTCGVGTAEFLGQRVAAAEVPDFAPQQWLGNKGIRVLDRSARLLCVACHLALEGAGLTNGEPAAADDGLGLICGTLFGGLHSIVSFDWSGLTEGPSYVNPMQFPNTVINSPAGQAAIRFRLKGVNSTVCAGLASGLYALHYGAEALRLGRARLLLAGGVEELCEESVLGFRKLEAASPTGSVRPFRKDSDGTVPGEGSALLVLEPAESAMARGVTPWAEVAGFGCAHDAEAVDAYRASGEGASAAMKEALETAGIGAGDVGCVIAGASGSRAGDATEARALAHVLGERLAGIPVSAPKASFGEAMGASGALCALAGVLALKRRAAPPTAGCQETNYGLRLSAEPQPFEEGVVLVNALSCDGNNASLVLRRWTG